MLLQRLSSNKIAAIIVSSEAIISQLIRLTSNLILTRLLAPEMFGVMVIATLFTIAITMLSDVGLKQKYIQHSDIKDTNFLNTCWSIQVIRGIGIAFFLIVVAALLWINSYLGIFLIDTAYSDKNLPFLIVFLSITALAQGFNSLNIYELDRNINVYELSKINIITHLAGTIVMIMCALLYQEIWVLIVSPVVSSFVLLYLSFNTKKVNVSFKFKIDRNSLKEIYDFGKWIFLGTVFSFFLLHSDRIILGALLTPDILGVYAIAYLFSNAARELFSRLITKIVYPNLTRAMRDSPEYVMKIMYNFRVKVDVITFSLAGFLYALGSYIIEFLYDSRYYEAGWIFEILIISIIFTGFNISHYTLMAKGKSYSYAVVNFFSVVVFVVGLPWVYQTYGLEYAIYFIALKNIFTLPVIYYMQYKEKIFSIFNEIRAAPMFVIFYLVGLFFESLFIF